MENKKMANCPHCQKPILCEGQFTSFMRFNIRCPWCQTFLKVEVEPKISVQVIKLNRVDESEVAHYPLLAKKEGSGPSKLFDILLVLLLLLFGIFQSLVIFSADW